VTAALQSNSVALRFRGLDGGEVAERRPECSSLACKLKLAMPPRSGVRAGSVGNGFDPMAGLPGARLGGVVCLLNSTG